MLVWAPLPSVAVTAAFWVAVTVPAVAVKVAELEAAGTVTDAGTVRAELADDKVTAEPPLGAARFRTSVQFAVADGGKLDGLQAKELTVTVATRLMVTLCELLPSVAVTVADWLLGRVAVVTLNVAEVDAAGTVTDAGTVKVVFVFVKVTWLPPVGAA